MSAHTLPPTRDVSGGSAVVHRRRSRLKFLLSAFDPLNVVVADSAMAPSLLQSAISFYNIALPLLPPSFQVLLRMGRF